MEESEKAAKKEEDEKANLMRSVKKMLERREEAMRIIGKIEVKDMKTAELKAVVKYKMRGKEEMPKVNEASLLQRYHETISRQGISLNDRLEMMKNENKRNDSKLLLKNLHRSILMIGTRV